MTQSFLGGETSYVNQYDPSQLLPIDRGEGRSELGIQSSLPFQGVDLWNAYEFTYLDDFGLPHQLALRIQVPVNSPTIIESKSMKLYLGSFAGSRFEDRESVLQTIHIDLTTALGVADGMSGHADDGLSVSILDESALQIHGAPSEWINLDLEKPNKLPSEYDASMLRLTSNQQEAAAFYTNAFRSLCPVTDQPDYARIVIGYEGGQLDRVALLQYLLSYREHGDFAEQVAERVFVDLDRALSPQSLWVRAEFTRRGGIDINTLRFDGCEPAPYRRHARQ